MLPTASGVACGLLLDVSALSYIAFSAACVAGGLTAGREHLGARDGAGRGAVGGTLFGSCLLLGHHLGAGGAQVALPDPESLQVVITAAFGVLLGAIGGATRRRALRRRGLAWGTAAAQGEPAQTERPTQRRSNLKRR